MKIIRHTIILSLTLTSACVDAHEQQDPDGAEAQFPDDTTSDTGSDSTDTGEQLNPWCCWCDAGETLCVDWQGETACADVGDQLGADTQEAQCTGLPVLGSLECLDLVCEAPEDVSLVVDAHDRVVGQLLTPSASELANVDDVFAGDPGVVLHLVSDGGFAFLLNWAGPTFIQIAHDEVMFTDSGCEGSPVDWMATPISGVDEYPIELCDDAGIAASLDKVLLHYSQESIAANWLEQGWPGALGWLVTRGDSGLWYQLPMAQEWPSVEHVSSVRSLDGSCSEALEPFDACVVTFIETDWHPVRWEGPYRIVTALEMP